MISYKLSLMVWNMSYSSVLWAQPTLHSLHIVICPSLIQASFHTMLQEIHQPAWSIINAGATEKEWSTGSQEAENKTFVQCDNVSYFTFQKKEFNFSLLVTAAMLFRQQKFCSCFKKYDIVENWFESYELILHICLLPS